MKNIYNNNMVRDLRKDLINFIYGYDSWSFWEFFIQENIIGFERVCEEKDYSEDILNTLNKMSVESLRSWFWEIKERSYDFIEEENEDNDYNYYMYKECCRFEEKHNWSCGEGGWND